MNAESVMRRKKKEGLFYVQDNVRHTDDFYLMGVIGGIGILSKLVSEGTLRSLVKAAENMSKSRHRFYEACSCKI